MSSTFSKKACEAVVHAGRESAMLLTNAIEIIGLRLIVPSETICYIRDICSVSETNMSCPILRASNVYVQQHAFLPFLQH